MVNENEVLCTGQLIKDIAKFRNIPQYAIREKLEMTNDDFKSLLTGTLQLTTEVADKITANFGGSTKFWLAYDREFRKRLD